PLSRLDRSRETDTLREQGASNPMTWTKGKIAIVIGIATLLVIGGTILIIKRKDISQGMTLAEGHRAIASKKAEVLELSSYDLRAEQFDAMANSQFPQWSCIPRGFQTFLHVPIQIDGIKCLWGSGNAQSGLSFDEEL